MRTNDECREDVRWGVHRGLVTAAFYSAVAVIASLDPATRTRYFGGYDISVVSAILVLFACGLLGGAIIGVLRPLGRASFVGAASVGALVGAIVGVGMALTMLGFPLTGEYVFLSGVFACIGIVTGIGFRLRHRRRARRS